MAATVVQYAGNRRAPATGSTIVVTLGAVPILGNMLVAHCINSADNAVLPTLNNGTWTLIAHVHSGNGTNWDNVLYYQKVVSTLSTATTMTTGGQTAGFKECTIIECNGVDTFDRFISTSNSSTTSGSISPITGKDLALISGVGVRDNTPPPSSRGNPVAGQNVYSTTAMASMVSLERMIANSTGSYTIGVTGSPANSSFIGAAFYGTPAAPTTQGYVLGMAQRFRERVTRRRTIFVPDPVGYDRRQSGVLVPA